MQFPEESWIKLHLKFWYFALQKNLCYLLFLSVYLSRKINVFQCRLEDNTGTELRKTAEKTDTEGSFPYIVLSTLPCHRFGIDDNISPSNSFSSIYLLTKLYTAGVFIE